jgi:hypothetical protein
MQLQVDDAGNVWDTSRGQPRFVRGPQQNIQTKPADPKLPYEVQSVAGQAAAAPYAAPRAVMDLQQGRKSIENTDFGNENTLRTTFNALPEVKNYSEALGALAGAMKAPKGAQGDLSVIYAFAKAQDPGSVVREGEMQMANATASLIAQLKVQYKGFANGKGLPPEVRTGLIEAARQKVAALRPLYDQQRNRFAELAQQKGFDPDQVIGEPLYNAVRPIEEQYIKANGGTPKIAGEQRKEIGPEEKAQFFDILERDGPDAADAYLRQFGKAMTDKTAANRPYSKALAEVPGTYGDSYLGQGLSGANEGLAGVLGAPADLAAAAINLVPKGINALANTNIPTLPSPIGGGEWWRNRLTDVGSIQAPTSDPSKQFVRRVGESVGASAIPAGFAGTAGRAAAGLLSGVGGGLGAATAQQVAPGNPLAEMAGEVVGGGMFGAGALKAGQRMAQRKIEAKIPTVDDLKQEASNLYRQAETRGVTASPAQTKKLAADLRQTLRDEGQLGPNGKITDADTATTKAFNLVEQYAGKPMTPKEINTVRTVLGDGRQSVDPSDRRLSGVMLEQFDNWANPLAPEFGQARSVASRYLQAQDLERARELAGARAGQFTGSGFENALRTEYRGLDRGNIRDRLHFAPEVTEAIEKVSRGTPTSNAFRGLGRLAPTGPVSGMGSVVPALGVGAMTDPVTGGMFGAGLAGTGILGRTVATRMGINAADEAELIARNGGNLPQAPLIPDNIRDYMAWLAATQQAKYLSSPER